MKVLIAEDEQLAAKRLEILLEKYDTQIEVVSVLESVEEVVCFLQREMLPDLLFLDIHLSDGYIFEIFEHISTYVPIIFTTAYEEYSLKAFKFNSIDYLLKPISFESLCSALAKFRHTQYGKANEIDLQSFIKSISRTVSETGHTYKSRFLVKYGDKMQYQNIEDIAYFYTEDKACFLITKKGQRFSIEYTLEQLEDLLNPALFFRINRSFIVKIDAIKEFKSYINSRLKLILEPLISSDVIVSREKVGLFKQWIDQ